MPYEPDSASCQRQRADHGSGAADGQRGRGGGRAHRRVYDGKPDMTGKDVIDLRGLTLIPGFHDAHNHMIGFGLSLTEIDLRTDSQDELYARVAAKAATTPAGEWIIGSGYDQTRTGAHPHRDALDAIAPNHRVWLKHTSSHMCVVNSLVLADLGIDRDRPAGRRRPGHRRRGRPPHRPAGGTRPGTRREPDPSLSADHPDRRRRRAPAAGTWPKASPRSPRPASAAAGSASPRSSLPPTSRPATRAGCTSGSS